VAGAGPDQVLVCSSKNLDRLGLGTVASQAAVVVPVSTHQIRQHFGVAGIRFRPGNLVALAVARDR
jgi:hypothetical protein